MNPGQKQTIEFILNNSGDEETTYAISINQGYTNAQGYIDYSEKNIQIDNSLKYPIKDLVTYDKEVTIAGQESKKVPIDIQMPSKVFDGQIMAGIQVTKKNEDTKNNSIDNEIGYIIGLKLQETDTEVKRDIQLVSVKL